MQKLISTYNPITLEEMKGIRLMNRIDTKFVTTLPQLEKLLQMALAPDFGGFNISPNSNLSKCP